MLGVALVRYLGLHVGLRSNVEIKSVRRVTVLERRTRNLVLVVAEGLRLRVVPFGRENVFGFDTPVHRGERYVVVVKRCTLFVVPDGGRREVWL